MITINVGAMLLPIPLEDAIAQSIKAVSYTHLHAYLLQRKYPHAEIAFSCPRLRPIINNDRINPMDVHEPQLLQVVCAYRLFMPFASITVSTRECARVRDNLVNIAATKISAGVSTGTVCLLYTSRCV